MGEIKMLNGQNNRGLGNYDQNSSSIGRALTLLSLRDQHIQVKDLVDVNGWLLSEACYLSSFGNLDRCSGLFLGGSAFYLVAEVVQFLDFSALNRRR